MTHCVHWNPGRVMMGSCECWRLGWRPAGARLAVGPARILHVDAAASGDARRRPGSASDASCPSDHSLRSGGRSRRGGGNFAAVERVRIDARAAGAVGRDQRESDGGIRSSGRQIPRPDQQLSADRPRGLRGRAAALTIARRCGDSAGGRIMAHGGSHHLRRLPPKVVRASKGRLRRAVSSVVCQQLHPPSTAHEDRHRAPPSLRAAKAVARHGAPWSGRLPGLVPHSGHFALAAMPVRSYPHLRHRCPAWCSGNISNDAPTHPQIPTKASQIVSMTSHSGSTRRRTSNGELCHQYGRSLTEGREKPMA
jgi:hypothetical protein